MNSEIYGPPYRPGAMTRPTEERATDLIRSEFAQNPLRLAELLIFCQSGQDYYPEQNAFRGRLIEAGFCSPIGLVDRDFRLIAWAVLNREEGSFGLKFNDPQCWGDVRETCIWRDAYQSRGFRVPGLLSFILATIALLVTAYLRFAGHWEAQILGRSVGIMSLVLTGCLFAATIGSFVIATLINVCREQYARARLRRISKILQGRAPHDANSTSH